MALFTLCFVNGDSPFEDGNDISVETEGAGLFESELLSQLKPKGATRLIIFTEPNQKKYNALLCVSFKNSPDKTFQVNYDKINF